MTVTINGTSGITTPGVINSGDETVAGNSTVSGNLLFDSGYGSDAVAYGCRAWVNFNGTGTVAIRASGNVSSITDLGTGDYTVNFTNALADANYSAVCSAGALSAADTPGIWAITTTSVHVTVGNWILVANRDSSIVNVSVFR